LEAKVAELQALIAERDGQLVELRQKLDSLLKPKPAAAHSAKLEPNSTSPPSNMSWMTIIGVWVLTLAIVYALGKLT